MEAAKGVQSVTRTHRIEVLFDRAWGHFGDRDSLQVRFDKNGVFLSLDRYGKIDSVTVPDNDFIEEFAKFFNYLKTKY